MKQNIPIGKYKKISAIYISLLGGQGCTCNNCGRLICNIVTVEHEGGKSYTIGQDCAKTLFSKQENEAIDREIKEYKSNQKRAVKAAEMQKRTDNLNILLAAAREVGINNTNINTVWAKEKFNELNNYLSNKAGYQIAYNRH